MPDHEDSLGGDTFSGDAKADPAEQSLGDGATMGGDTAAHSLGDQSTFGDANVDDELFDDGMEVVDLSIRYTEEGVLGKGGFGEVILATDTRLNRKVAIKRIIGKAARSKTAVQRFLTEAQSMAELNHTNIVQIHDYGRSTDGPFLIMECVQGGSLLEKCKTGPIELDEAVNIFGQLCDGLAKAHAANIIHRDIKPANVLMTEDGIPKLTDFGLAKDDTADTGMTMEGAVIGTLDFMPPEQRKGAEFTDHRSDLWSLAATFYQMLTGKSPKVINISAITPELQSVVAKALEESKDDRFQSALEMKEAVLQAATAGLNASRDLGEGECPNCGTTNPSDRKFCRNTECAASLEVDCLSCKTAMPMWEGVCGSCGTKQDALIEEAKEGLQRKHDEAEQFLNELKFDDALKAASEIGEQKDLRLQQFAAWHEEFSARLESSRTSEHARLEELLREAHAHEQAYDYEAALQTLTQVAPSLKQTTVSGSEDTADVLTERLTTKQSRLKELEGIVRERVGKREITGLLPIVNDLLTLKPDRPEVQKLKAQLEKRGTDLREARDSAINKATQQLNEQQYAQALATLNTVSEETWNEQLQELKTKTSDLLNQLNTLRDKITTAVNGNQLKDLLPAVQECLTLKADQDDLVKLKQDLIDREAQMDARNQQIISQAQQHMQQLQFDAVVQTLDTIAPEYQTLTTTGLIQQAHQLSVQRQSLLSAVPVALSNKNYQVAIKSISQYLGEIANAGLQDPQIQRLLDEAKGKESASIRKKKLVKLGIAAACVVVVLITGVVIKVNLDAKALENAIAAGNWETALELDSDNAEGLRLKAAAEKAAAEKPAILARGPITNAIGMKLKEIPAGTFVMGSPETAKGRQSDETQHAVTITKAFYMQTTEVTQGQWKAVMGTEPWKRQNYVKEGADYPAVHLSWADAVSFCRTLSEKESKTYRLPTEAEWEYACRAGTKTTWSFGNDEKELGDYAWYDKSQHAYMVGLKKPNAFGLYDMHGNVYEWCNDYYKADYYKHSPEKDPAGPTSGSIRVFRGGAWSRAASRSHSAYRGVIHAGPRNYVYNYGFRLVRELD
jgi:formylglycine-generating enzyme